MATAAAALPAAPASADPLTGIDLSTYVRVGRYDLPEPTRTTPPAGSLLAQEASGVAYDPVTQGLYIVGDGGTSVVHVDKTGNLVDSMTLATGSSEQGTEFFDTEGITYVGNGKFVFTEERDRQVDEFTYTPNTTLTRADVKTVKLGTTIGNIGLEGISNDPQTGGFILVKEKTPESIFQTGIDFDAGTATNGSASTDESTNLFDPALAGLDDFSDVFALANLTTLTGSDATHLLVISQESAKIENISRTGTVSSSLRLVGDSDNPLSIADQTQEGVTMDDDGDLYVVSEAGGGADHPQLWVFRPSTVPNQAPTGVTLTHQLASVADNTSTASRVKVADVSVADDGLGTNDLSVTGADAADFEVDSTGLYLKAGTTLDHIAKSSYTVSVAVDDTGVGATPDATSSPYTLAVTATAVTPSIVVSEVAPWGSGDASYAADWFELTNTGTTPVDLTGWKFDDDSDAFASGVTLNGVSTLAPGKSAVFVAGDAGSTIPAFKTAWFGSNPPAGLTMGYYNDSLGLSTGGDEVNIFDALGNAVTGVKFGGSTSGRTFDNAAGLGATASPRPTVTTLSTAGINGAFATSENVPEVGSPGATQTPLTISEVSPWGSDSTYAADWFEVTNNGTHAVDLTAWKFDDDSDAFGTAVTLNGVGSLAPGKSAIFMEGGTTEVAAFTTAWFGSDPPADFAVGYYSGSGVGLKASGDEVNLFDPAGDHVTGIKFGQSTAGVSFDNSAGLGGTGSPRPTISTLSALGVNGAVTVGGETGSPGTVVPDTTAPVITFTGNAGTYASDAQVNIACAAVDEPHGSGIAMTDCADITGTGASFGVGTHDITVTATDNAGNVGTATVTFTVTAPVDGTPSGNNGPVTPISAPGPAIVPTPVVTPPFVPTPTPAATKPKPKPKAKVTVAKSTKAATLAKGYTTTLSGLKAKSKVTLTVRFGSKLLKTVTATADKAGKAHIKVKLTKAQLAGLHGKKLALRFAVTGANGKKSTITASLKVS
ncbi:MAG TPA: SdiA-regulated domain-containing protein [Baekduia sp.]